MWYMYNIKFFVIKLFKIWYDRNGTQKRTIDLVINKIGV